MSVGSETEVVISAKAGNRSAFEQLVVRYQNLITALAYSRTGDIQRSEDIAQQAFLTAWQKRSELKDPSRFGGWLRSIARNITLNSNRKSNRLDRSAQSLDGATEPVVETEPVQKVVSSEQQQLLWSTLNNIPEQYREPLVLFYREDKSVSQVADMLGLSIDATKQRLARGRAMLKTEVESFVEDLLGASKPDRSFASSVMLALPGAATSAGGKAVVQGTAAAGVKSMVAKLGTSLAGPMLGVLGGVAGLAGAWYGTRKAAEHATSDEERILMWSFFNKTLVMTVAYTALLIGVSYATTDESSVLGQVALWATLAFFGIQGTMIVRFISRQKALHAVHGKPAYLDDIGGQEAISVKELRWSMLGSTVGCWAWLIVMAAKQSCWILCALATFTMLSHLISRWVGAPGKVKLGEQLRYHATAVLTNTFLSAIVLMVGGLFGFGYPHMPNWGMAIMVIGIGWFVAWAIWIAATKADKRDILAEKGL